MEESKGIGLVMEGGAMRGLFTVGILDVFMEHDIVLDGAMGVSAGAAFGCNYKSHQAGRVLRYNRAYSKDPRYCSVRSLIRTGDMFGAQFCYHEIPDKLDIMDMKTYNESKMEFWVVCTDVITGKPVYHRCDCLESNELEWMRASASMPLASRVVEVDGYHLLDGGISDSIPLKHMEELGYDKNVVILTQPLEYVKGENKMLPLIRLSLHKYPNFVETAKHRHEVYNAQVQFVKEEEQKGNAFVFRPDEKLPVGHVEHDPEKLQVIYDIGRRTALARLDELKEYLTSCKAKRE